MRLERLMHLSIRCIVLYIWEFKTLLTFWYVLLLLKIGCSHMCITMPSIGGGPYLSCHTRYSHSILHTYWSCFVIVKCFVSYVFVELCAVFLE